MHLQSHSEPSESVTSDAGLSRPHGSSFMIQVSHLQFHFRVLPGKNCASCTTRLGFPLHSAISGRLTISAVLAHGMRETATSEMLREAPFFITNRLDAQMGLLLHFREVNFFSGDRELNSPPNANRQLPVPLTATPPGARQWIW